MRLYNSDIAEAERSYALDAEVEEEVADGDSCRSFFDLRQRTLLGIDQMSAFRIVISGLLRKLRVFPKRPVSYSEVEDALGRYFRLLDADMQKFATLHDTLREAADKMAESSGARDRSSSARSASRALLLDGMREIAAVLLACGKMQRRALDFKVSAQRPISGAAPPAVPFTTFASFLDEALNFCDQLKRKHEELQQQRIRAIANASGGGKDTLKLGRASKAF